MNAISLRQQADRRIAAAVAEGLDQLAKGRRTNEVLVVLKDAAAIVADLWEQADEVEDREQQIRDHDELTIARVRGFGWVDSARDEGDEITESLERSNAWFRDNPRVEATS